jgi:hypothetical protein
MIEIISNGSKWVGQSPDSIDRLLQVLGESPLAPGLAPFIYDQGNGHFRFFGSFANIAHVFQIYTDDPQTIERLTAAIRTNQEREDYRQAFDSYRPRVHKYGDGGGDSWREFIEAMHSGQPAEIDQELFDYFLDVLPPVYMGRTVKLATGETVRASFGFAEGAEIITAFYRLGGRLYCCQTTERAKG